MDGEDDKKCPCAKYYMQIVEELRLMRELMVSRGNAPTAVSGEIQAVLVARGADGKLQPLEMDAQSGGIPVAVAAHRTLSDERPIVTSTGGGGS